MTNLERQRVFGLDFVTGTTVAELADRLLREASSATTQWRCLVTPNVDHLVRYRSHVDEYTVAEHAFMVLPDGMPIVWASRLLRASLSGRLPGSDLFARLWPQIAEQSTPTVVLAASERVASLLRAEHPNVEMIVAPMFDLDDHETIETLVTQMVDASRRIDARLLFITVSMPKSHLLALRLEQRWRDDVGLGGRLRTRDRAAMRVEIDDPMFIASSTERNHHAPVHVVACSTSVATPGANKSYNSIASGHAFVRPVG